jgi:hypothetical protein
MSQYMQIVTVQHRWRKQRGTHIPENKFDISDVKKLLRLSKSQLRLEKLFIPI